MIAPSTVGALLNIVPAELVKIYCFDYCILFSRQKQIECTSVYTSAAGRLLLESSQQQD